MAVHLAVAQMEDRSVIAELIYQSTNRWYQAHGMQPIFTGDVQDCALFVDVYQRLDDGHHWIARDESGRLCGSCFTHPRETHVGLGIMNVHPDYFGRGIARKLLEQTLELAGNLPVRLLSSALNLDSYSLYHRAGFKPYALYQDMAIPVPAQGLPCPALAEERVRPALLEDRQAILALEHELLGIQRSRDIDYFLNDRSGLWRIAVWESAGKIRGYLASVAHPASRMLGPGCCDSEAGALDLIGWMLNQHHRGATPVVLVPSQMPGLSRTLAQWGGRICELHLAQVKGSAQAPQGVVLPTFLPESG